MRIRRQEGYLLQKIGDTHYLLPYGQKIADQQRGMELNETARILWEALETPKTMEELQQKMIRCYEVPEEEQEELKKDIQAFVKELLAFGAVRRELGSPDGTCAGELKIAGISIAVYGKEGCIPKQFASFEKKRGKEEATEKTEGEAAKKTGEKEVEETVIKTENRQDAADLTLELIEHVPESHQNGNILIRNKDLTVCAWEEGYVLWFPALKNIYEIWMKADGSFACIYYRLPMTEEEQDSLFLAIRPVFLFLAQKKGMFALHSASLLYLEKAPEDKIVSLTKEQKTLRVMQRMISPPWTAGLMKKNLAFAEEIANEKPVYFLRCTKNDTAAEVMHHRITEDELAQEALK